MFNLKSPETSEKIDVSLSTIKKRRSRNRRTSRIETSTILKKALLLIITNQR